MAGGLIQLAAYGAQDHYLTGNPNISFFKCVYRQYTNFAMESIRINFEGNSHLLTDQTSKLICKINRNADLISNCYFRFNLPDIYVDDSSKRKFKWIKNIGTNIIESVSLYIGGALIDKQYGEWLNIWRELNLTDTEKKNHDILIGNVPQLYDPKEFNGEVYPYSEPTSGLTEGRKIEDCPSIPKSLITVPLCFWFNNNTGLALPLVALQYVEVEIHIELRPLKDLYLITDPGEDLYYKPTDLNSDEGIQHFMKDTPMINVDSQGSRLLYFNLDAFMEVNYIFLDNKERKKFADTTHSYLIEQIFRTPTLGHNNYVNIDLVLQHPVKELIWVGKRSDIENRNDWNNYTNWIYEDVAPYSNKYLNKFDYKLVGNHNYPSVVSNQFVDQHQDNLKFKYLQKNIIRSSDLLLNGLFRYREKGYEYFNDIQNYQHHRKNIKSGINIYSFCINPEKFQPSGSCNMSRINKVSIRFDINEIPFTIDDNTFYEYNFNIYSINYNILRIVGGMGSLQFSN
jgi:hypothetical protein